jgi:hypothetical protein
MTDKGIPNKERIIAACLKDGFFGKDILLVLVSLIPQLGAAVSRPGKVSVLRPTGYSLSDAPCVGLAQLVQVGQASRRVWIPMY